MFSHHPLFKTFTGQMWMWTDGVYFLVHNPLLGVMRTPTSCGRLISMKKEVRSELMALGTKADVNSSKWLLMNMSSSSEANSCMRRTNPSGAFPLCLRITRSNSFCNRNTTLTNLSVSSLPETLFETQTHHSNWKLQQRLYTGMGQSMRGAVHWHPPPPTSHTEHTCKSTQRHCWHQSCSCLSLEVTAGARKERRQETENRGMLLLGQEKRGGRTQREQREVTAGAGKERRQETENSGRLLLGQEKRAGRRQRTEEGYCWEGKVTAGRGGRRQRTEEGHWRREKRQVTENRGRLLLGQGERGGRRKRTEEGYCWGREREEAGDREQRKVTAGAGRERRLETENRGRLLLGQGERGGGRQRTEEGYCWGRKREAGDWEQRKVTAGAGKERQETENRGRLLLGQGKEAGDWEQRKVTAGAGRERRQETENRGRLLLGQGERGGRRQRTEEGYCWGREREAGDWEQRKVTAGAGRRCRRQGAELRKVIAWVRKERRQETENRGRSLLGQGKRGRRPRTEEGHCWGRERMQETGDRTEACYCWGREREEAGDREQRIRQLVSWPPQAGHPEKGSMPSSKHILPQLYFHKPLI